MLLDVSLYVMHIELQLVHKRHSKFCVQRMHKCINKPLMTLQKLRCESIGRNKGVNERRSSLRLRGCAQVLRLAWHGAPDWCVGSRHTWQLVEGGMLDQRWNRIRSKGTRMTNPRSQRDCSPHVKGRAGDQSSPKAVPGRSRKLSRDLSIWSSLGCHGTTEGRSFPNRCQCSREKKEGKDEAWNAVPLAEQNRDT